MNQRLFDVDGSAEYLSVGAHTIRSFVRLGVLVPVRLPSCRSTSESNRRLLFDRNDLDALVDAWKRTSTAAPNAGLSAASVKGWKLKPVRKRKEPTCR